MFKYDNALWNNAKFIKTDYKNYFQFGVSPWGKERPLFYQHKELDICDGLPMFIKDFELKDIQSAKLTFTALGCVDAYLNGKRLGDDELKPGCVNFSKRTLYHTYDVSENIAEGKNRLLLVAATGWCYGRIMGGCYGESDPAVMACLTAETAQGRVNITTDESWSCTVGGQILTADIWDGEYRDGRLDSFEKISKADYDISAWKPVDIFDGFEGEITPFVGPTVKIRKELSRKADSITVYNGTKDNGTDYGEINIFATPDSFPVKLNKGKKIVVDLGQEIVGWSHIKVCGKAGTQVRLRYAEFLNDSGSQERGNDGAKGSVYTINLRSAIGKAYYILAGGRDEEYRSTFTFFGFRYVEISADEDVEILDYTAEVVGTDNKEIGHMETSDELVNKLISNIIWGQRGNYLSVPTDCPQRDERYGWTGDAQAFSMTAAYNADVLGFFKKWLQDVRDSQTPDGAYTDIAPTSFCCSSFNAAAWGDAGIIIPYNLLRMYGDLSIVEEHYASMEKYIAQLIEKYGMSGPIPRYGDWLAYDFCKNEFISSAIFVRDLDMMIYMSKALGKIERAEHYANLRKDAFKYFEENFMENGKPAGKTQADKVLCLAFDFLDEDKAKEVADELCQQIKENGNRLSTGFVGTYNLCLALSKYGKDNMAYTLLMQRDEPSWLYSIDQGATTIWERWNSYTKAKGFGDVGMNSFNHYAYGSVQEWMYRYMAGIEPDEDGFRSFILQPRVDTRTGVELPQGQERMKWIRTSYNSAAGLIESAWNNDDSFVYECSVPEGTTAKLLLPKFGEKLIVNGTEHSLTEYPDEKGCAVIMLGAGSYTFEEM